jgi:hypothetical protein
MARIIRNFAFRYFKVQGNGVGALSRVVSEAARTLRDTTRPVEDTVNRLASASTDADFVAAFKEVSLSPAPLGFFALAAIENHLSAGAGVGVWRQSPAQHLEHILPQRPAPSAWGHVPAADAQVNLWRIGNLTVLEANINRHIRNRAFAEKDSNANQLDYQNSVLRLPAQIRHFLDGGQWTVKSIVDRQSDLATRYAAAVWPLVW